MSAFKNPKWNISKPNRIEKYTGVCWLFLVLDNVCAIMNPFLNVMLIHIFQNIYTFKKGGFTIGKIVFPATEIPVNLWWDHTWLWSNSSQFSQVHLPATLKLQKGSQETVQEERL
jgi:hypothetical protein